MAFFYWTQMNLANLALTTHIRTQDLRNPDGAVCLQVVLQESDQHTAAEPLQCCSGYGQSTLPSAPLTRIRSRLAWASPKLEQLPTSKYFFCLGDHASTSTDFTFSPPGRRSSTPEVRTGISRERNRSTVFCHSLSYRTFAVFRFADYDHFLLSQTDGSGIRLSPRCRERPFSLRKQGE